MKLTVKGRKGIMPYIMRQAERIVDAVADRSADNLLQTLIARTPIDTGYARSRWSMTRAFNPAGVAYYISRTTPLFGLTRSYTFTNDAPYIDVLNTGWSQQAPARFIEQTILQEGYKINSTIVPKRK